MNGKKDEKELFSFATAPTIFNKEGGRGGLGGRDGGHINSLANLMDH